MTFVLDAVQCAQQAAEYFDEAAKLFACAKSLEGGSIGSGSQAEFEKVQKKMDKHGVPKDKIKKGPKVREDTVKELKTDGSWNMDVGLGVAEAAFVIIAWQQCCTAIHELAKADEQIPGLRVAFDFIQRHYFTGDNAVQELLDNPTRRKEVRTELLRLEDGIKKAREAAQRGKTAAAFGAGFSVPGLILGVFMAGGGATAPLARIGGAVGAASSAVTLGVSIHQFGKANALLAELDVYRLFAHSCTSAIDKKVKGEEITEAEMQVLLERSRKLKTKMDELRADGKII